MALRNKVTEKFVICVKHVFIHLVKNVCILFTEETYGQYQLKLTCAPPIFDAVYSLV